MEKIWLKGYQAGVPSTINPDSYTSLADLFVKSCQKFATRPAFSNFGTTLTYAELLQLSQQLAAFFQKKLGLKKGERFGIMMPNVLQYPVVMFAALQLGLVVVNINPLYTPDELVHQLESAEVDAIIVLTNFAHTLEKALPKIAIKHIIVTEIGDLLTWPKSFAMNFFLRHMKTPAWHIPSAITFRNILKSSSSLFFDPVSLTGDDMAFLQYTGGTTGVMKGAMLTHRNLVANLQQILVWVNPVCHEKNSEIIITALPLYHIFCLTANCLTFMALGGLNVLITNPRDILHLVSTISKVPFSAMTGVNTLFNALLNNEKFSQLNFSHLKIALGGGAPVQHVVAERWKKVTGKVLLEGYGLTEASPAISVSPMNLENYNGSIGLPLPSTNIAIWDDNGKELPLGEIGELCVQGPQVMKGYWKESEETKRVLTDDGWLKTGDIARLDERGFIYIVDRKKDMILVSGFNVYPSEIEGVIAEHPGVLEVAVIGVPDEITGEAVKAFVVKKDPHLSSEMIQAYCHDHLTGYKRPKYIEFRDVLPKSNVGKILRRELR